MNTGYYASPKRISKIHLDIDGHPACHAHIGKDMNFQWCAGGIYLSYLECKHCIKIAAKISDNEFEKYFKIRR